MSGYSNQYSDELMHYGVPGMKWGHRKAVITSGGLGRRNVKSRAANSQSSGRPSANQSRKVNTNSSQAIAKTKPKSTSPKKSVKTGKKRAAKVLSKLASTSIKSIAYGAKTGMGLAKMAYDNSDTARANKKMMTQLNMARQMSPEYRRKFGPKSYWSWD